MLFKACTKWLAGITSAVMALGAPMVALADCTTYGGGGAWGASVTPGSQTFTNLTDYKSFSINNTGTNSWSINSWQLPIGFTNNDPNGCYWKTYAGGQSCTVSIKPTAYGASGQFSVTTSGGVNPFAFLTGPAAPGAWGLSLTPASQAFVNLTDSKPITIKNTGTSSWKINAPQIPAGFTYSDPNGCFIVDKIYIANQTCTFSVKPFAYQSAGDLSIATVNGYGGLTGSTHLDGPDSAPLDPILFVHGYNSSGAIWSTMVTRFVQDGWSAPGLLTTMDYGTSQSNATIAATVGQRVDQIRALTGAPRVDIIAHSMGSLSSRYYLKNLGGTAKVDDWVSLAGPNHGTAMGGALVCTAVIQCGEMNNQPMSPFLTSLNSGDETPGTVRYGTWRSECDPVINPDNSTVLSDAVNNTWPPTPTSCPTSHSGIYTDLGVYDQVRVFVR